MAGFRSEYPGIRLRLVEEGGKIVERLLSESKLDLGFVVLPVDEQAFETLTLAERRLFFGGEGGSSARSERIRAAVGFKRGAVYYVQKKASPSTIA
ncbi:LysR substrate-binding domain-containing protein [Cohnella ginsengisoli]|uniref:LysR substrate-binding domain-containing protein n=1 Tax=Cohnella ginsengisoli TaxID=425004 RepID=A0A9X4QQK0_9BACL|nr:LysR substrate-binding domain-containing protein [Cohnella ginsengisoli]MDG0793805.1 LysR substrate-binding domain-containing protein [Cohnella ginsengisoli]